MDCFAALNIQATNQSHLIKLAYSKALQVRLSDISSTNFTTLRRHYIQALRRSRSIFDVSFSSKPTTFLENTDHLKTVVKQSDNNAPLDNMTILNLRHALSLQLHNPFILTKISKHFIEINKYRLAIDTLESILALSPDHKEAQSLLLTTEHTWHLRLVKRFNTLSPEDVEYLIRHKMHNNQYREALTLLKRAISSRLKGLHAPTLFRLSAECMASLRVDTAPHYFEKSLEYTHELNENPSATLLAYIEYLFAFKQFDTLLLLIDDLIKLNPNQHRYHFLKGESLSQTQHYKQGITSLRYAIGLSPNTSIYYDRIVHAYHGLGNTEKAGHYAKAGSEIHTEQLDAKA